MNPFDSLLVEPIDDELEQQDKHVSPSVVEDDFTALKTLDEGEGEGGEPFEETKYKRRKESKTDFNIKNNALKLAKQNRMEAWQLAEKQRISDAQSKLIEFENKAKKGISVSNYKYQKCY